MSYIINDTFFVRELIVPETVGVDVRDTENPFDNWIDTEARYCLGMALGQKLFTEFDGYVDAGGDLDVGAPVKWHRLVTGTEYTHRGVDYRWEGLIFTQGNVPVSLLAYFTYARWMTYQMSSVGGFGEQVGKAANAKMASGAARQVKAWNNFVSLYQGDMTTEDVVFKVDWRLQYQQTNYVSLLQFLLDNEDDYPDAALRLTRYKNRFSI